VDLVEGGRKVSEVADEYLTQNPNLGPSLV
jgi:hypothetical protein